MGRIPHLAYAAPILMLACGLLSMPYGFYTLLRFVVTGASIFLVLGSWQDKRIGWLVVFGVLAVLYNPIIPFRLGREVWLPANIVSIAIFCLHWWQNRRIVG